MQKKEKPLAAFSNYRIFVKILWSFEKGVKLMIKEKIEQLWSYAVKHNKIVFPVILVVAVAVTVSIGLSAKNEAKVEELQPKENQETSATVQAAAEEPQNMEVPLVANAEQNIYELIATYYNAMALGDEATLRDIYKEISDEEMLRIIETSKYIETYPTLDIYTKAGPEQGSCIAYVYYKVVFLNRTEEIPGLKAHYICTDDQGKLYFKSEGTESENEYINTVNEQDDVKELENRVAVEYNDMLRANPELLVYMEELKSQVNTAVGVILAQQTAETALAEEEQTPETGADDIQSNTAEVAQPGEQTEDTAEVLYATATTTVNVRSSDSEKADKLGKVAGGTKLQVLEQKVNGWSKVLFEDKEGFIKSEFLQTAESAENAEGIGMVTAATNVVIRSAAGENGERVGMLVGGDSAELLSRENGWCKIRYNGQTGYVKEDFVQ